MRYGDRTVGEDTALSVHGDDEPAAHDDVCVLHAMPYGPGKRHARMHRPPVSGLDLVPGKWTICAEESYADFEDTIHTAMRLDCGGRRGAGRRCRLAGLGGADSRRWPDE